MCLKYAWAHFLGKTFTKVDQGICEAVESHQPEKRLQLLADPVGNFSKKKMNASCRGVELKYVKFKRICEFFSPVLEGFATQDIYELAKDEWGWREDIADHNQLGAIVYVWHFQLIFAKPIKMMEWL